MKASVVIPTCNRLDVLRETVRRMLLQELSGGGVEIVVVDDRSTDGTAEWLAAEAARDRRLRSLRNPSKGLASARNAGLALARGELVCFVDDDLWVEPDFLAAHCRAHEENGASPAAVMGRMLPWPGNEPTVANLAFDHHLTNIVAEMERHGSVLPCEMLCTGNVSFRRADLGAEPLFDESFRGYGFEDTDLGYRLADRGLRLLFETRALAYHHTRTTVADNLRKCGEAGRSAVVFLGKHPRAVDRLQPVCEVPGVPASRRKLSLRRRLERALFFSPAAGVLMGAWLRLLLALGRDTAALRMLQRVCFHRYGRAFRRAARS